jgi:hypothetical protein
MIKSWLVPYIANMMDEKKQKKYLREWGTRIDKIYHQLYYRNKEDCLQALHRIRIDIMNLFEQGKINISSYQILNDRISQCERC